MDYEPTQEDREAAASGYYAWCSGNPVIPNRILGGDADDHSMVQAFARHRIAAEQRGKLEGARLALEAAGQHIQEYGPSDTIGNWEAAGAIRALDPAKIVDLA